jgi:hypothetical protein
MGSVNMTSIIFHGNLNEGRWRLAQVSDRPINWTSDKHSTSTGQHLNFKSNYSPYLLLSLLFNWTVNGFSPGGSNATIRQKNSVA